MPKIEVTHPDKTTITFEMCPYENQVIKGRSICSFRQGDTITKYQSYMDRPMGPYTVMMDHGIAKLVSINSNLIMDKVCEFTTPDWYLFSDFDADGTLKSITRPKKRIIDLELGEYFDYDGEILYRIVDGESRDFRALSLSPRLIAVPSPFTLVTPLGKLHIKNSEQIGSPR